MLKSHIMEMNQKIERMEKDVNDRIGRIYEKMNKEEEVQMQEVSGLKEEMLKCKKEMEEVKKELECERKNGDGKMQGVMKKIEDFKKEVVVRREVEDLKKSVKVMKKEGLIQQMFY